MGFWLSVGHRPRSQFSDRPVAWKEEDNGQLAAFKRLQKFFPFPKAGRPLREKMAPLSRLGPSYYKKMQLFEL